MTAIQGHIKATDSSSTVVHSPPAAADYRVHKKQQLKLQIQQRDMKTFAVLALILFAGVAFSNAEYGEIEDFPEKLEDDGQLSELQEEDFDEDSDDKDDADVANTDELDSDEAELVGLYVPAARCYIQLLLYNVTVHTKTNNKAAI